MKKFIVFFVFLILGSSTARASDSYVFILAAHDSPYWTTMGEGIKDAAKEKGIVPDIFEVQRGSDAEGELNICLTAIEKKPKIIVMGSLNPSIGIQCFKKAKAAGIIVADVDAGLTVAQAAEAGVDLAFSIGSDNYAVGEKAAAYVEGLIAGHKDPVVLVLEGAPGSVPGGKRVRGFRVKLQQLNPAAKLLSVPAQWDRLKAMNATTDVLLREPGLAVVYAANDVMALGAAEAIKNAGKTEQVKVVGVDGTLDARNAIMEGRLAATVAQLPYLIGERAMTLALEAVKDPSKTGLTETTPTPVLTKAIIVQKKEPLLPYVR